jgi:cytochrome c556
VFFSGIDRRIIGAVMYRTSLLAVTFAAIATTVFAQADLVAARKALMGETGKYMYRALPNMIKGDQPYDQATVDAAFAQMAGAAKKLPSLYAESTKGAPPSGRFGGSAKIWENKADFDAKVAAYGAAVAAGKGKATSLEGLKEAYSTVSRTCDSCHDSYRIRN